MKATLIGGPLDGQTVCLIAGTDILFSTRSQGYYAPDANGQWLWHWSNPHPFCSPSASPSVSLSPPDSL